MGILDLEIAARPVANSVARAPQFAGKVMIVGILGELSDPQEFAILKRLPTLLHRIKCHLEHNAVGVQMRFKGAGRIVREFGGDEVVWRLCGNHG